MRREPMALVAFFLLISTSYVAANTIPPSPTANFFGDSDGDTSITNLDIGQFRNTILGRTATYDTLQPIGATTEWNTCDADSDRSCTNLDIGQWNNAVLGRAVTIGDTPWVLENLPGVGLPTTGNVADTWIPFQINLFSSDGGTTPSGRPGFTVIGTILSGTAELKGRTCTPSGSVRDEAAAPGAQCALAVTQTDWSLLGDNLGLTESGAYGFQIQSPGGDVTIRFRVPAQPALDVPETILDVTANFACVPSEWVQIGPGSASGDGIFSSSSSPFQPSLALDSSGNPIVVWSTYGITSNEIYIKRWDGSAWVDIGTNSSSAGGISNNARTSLEPSIAVDSSGNPVVAWSDTSGGNYEIYIKRWDGGAWVDIGPNSSSGGGVSNNSWDSRYPSLALDSSGNPVVAWENSGAIYIKRWDGSAWVDIGANSSSGGGIGSGYWPSLAIDFSDNPVAAWWNWDYSGGVAEIYIKRWDGVSWVDIGTNSSSGGGISNNSGWSGYPSLAIDSSGNPIVAWEDYSSGDNEIYINRWDGGTWVDIGTNSSSGGGISNNSGYSYSPSLALDSSGNPVLAWSDSSGGDLEIYIKRWDGSAWVDIGTGSSSGWGISNNSGYSEAPSLALDSSDNPVVVWGDSYYSPINSYSIYIKRWGCHFVCVPSEWVEIGDHSAISSGINGLLDNMYAIPSSYPSNPSLALDTSDKPVVVWYSNNSVGTNTEVQITRWNGGDWVDIGTGSSTWGGISNNIGASFEPSLALDSSGNPVVAWSDDTDRDYEIYIKRWDGSAWADIGVNSSSSGGISNNSGDSYSPSLALDSNDNPVVAWYDNSGGDNEIYIKRWNGASWVSIGTGSSSGGGISNNVGGSHKPSLALDSYDNPVVAWDDDSDGNYEIYIKKWDGSAWIDIGANSSSMGGISNNAGDSYYPSLALDSSGNPVVAWDDNSGNNREVFIKRWNGSSWVDIGTNSSSGGGISNNSGGSYDASLALDSTGNPVVAWDDYSGGNIEIYIKRWDGSAWVEVGINSSSSSGISNNSGYSLLPSLALDSTGNPVVTWTDGSGGGYWVYIKRWWCP